MLANQAETPIEKALRFFVIGCGSIGKRHMRNLQLLNAGEIFVYDEEVSRRHEVMEKFHVEGVKNLEEGWDRSPNVAFITAPTSLHIPLALEAARHGCHLFIEKPLSDRLAPQLLQLLDIVKERNLITLVGCNMRFHPVLVKVKRLLEEQAIGQVVAARLEVGQYLPDWHPWEDYRKGYSARKDLGGGVILDAIHEIDYIRWMFGDIASVACLSGKLSHLETDTEDTAALLLQFTNGTIGEVHLDYVQRTASRTGHIIGDEGTIRWDVIGGEVHWYSTRTGHWETFQNSKDWDPNQIYIEEMKHFLRCLEGSETPAQDVFEATEVLKIALAAKRSSETRQFIKPGDIR